MIDLQQTETFRKWQRSLKDPVVQSAVAARMLQLSMGHAGDSKYVGDGVHELRIHIRPGYRIYYTWRGKTIVMLLSGGQKSGQVRDIAAAKLLAREGMDDA